ncbi:MAG: hypothetical protein WC796_01380 [Candidatus Pacearchaeota archaeon]|jgi:hypothetical protein
MDEKILALISKHVEEFVENSRNGEGRVQFPMWIQNRNLGISGLGKLKGESLRFGLRR